MNAIETFYSFDLLNTAGPLVFFEADISKNVTTVNICQTAKWWVWFSQNKYYFWQYHIEKNLTYLSIADEDIQAPL